MDRESQRTRLARAVRDEILPALEGFGVVLGREAARRLTAGI
jgi:hypothetical protein